jgi:hypothetical protein
MRSILKTLIADLVGCCDLPNQGVGEQILSIIDCRWKLSLPQARSQLPKFERNKAQALCSAPVFVSLARTRRFYFAVQQPDVARRFDCYDELRWDQARV